MSLTPGSAEPTVFSSPGVRRRENTRQSIALKQAREEEAYERRKRQNTMVLARLDDDDILSENDSEDDVLRKELDHQRRNHMKDVREEITGHRNVKVAKNASTYPIYRLYETMIRRWAKDGRSTAGQSIARSSHPYQVIKEKAPAMMRPVNTKNGRSAHEDSGAAVAVISQVAASRKIPNARLPKAARPG